MLNLFGKKPHQETPPTKYPAKSKPKTPKDSPRIHHSPKLILTPDSTKGIAYNSARISRPNGVGGISTSGSSSPTTEFVTPQASKSSVDQNKKRQPSPTNHRHDTDISAKVTPHGSFNQNNGKSNPTIQNKKKKKAGERVVTRTRPIRKNYRDRRNSVSSRESLISRERRNKQNRHKAKPQSKGHGNIVGKTASNAPIPNNPPYPIHDIIDTSFESHCEDEEEEGDKMPSGFEEVNRRSVSPQNKQQIIGLDATRNQVQQSTYTALDGSNNTTSRDSTNITKHNNNNRNSTIQQVGRVNYNPNRSSLESQRVEAVACILERTGSLARDSRRARRARELRRLASIREIDDLQPPSSSSINESRNLSNINTRRANRRNNISYTNVNSPQSHSNASQSNYNIPTSDFNVPELIIPNQVERLSLSRQQADISIQEEASTVTPIPQQQSQSQSESQSERQSQSRLQQTRNAIIDRLNSRIDASMFPIDLIDPPPLDEYSTEGANHHYNNNSNDMSNGLWGHSPPYRENLHKRVDLISFDPRYSIPVLRINKRLVKNSTNLHKVIRKLIKLQIVPEDVNLWDINKVDDGEFYNVLPRLLMNEMEASDQRQHQERQRQRQEDYENELQRALAISLEEENQREMFRGFRYQKSSNNRVIEQIVQSPDVDLNHGRFVDASEVPSHQAPLQPQEGLSLQRDLLRGFRYNQSRASRAAMNGLVETSMLANAIVDEGEDEQEGGGNGDEFIDVDEAIHSWRLHDLQENQSSNHRRLSPPHFRYLQLHQSHSHSSVSSFMTAY